MGDKARRNQPWAISLAIAAGTATVDIKANPGPNSALVVTTLHVTIKTTAAQTAEFQDASGAVKLAALGTSQPIGLAVNYQGEQGVELPKNNALQYVPSAAGYALDVIAEGYIKRSGDLSAV